MRLLLLLLLACAKNGPGRGEGRDSAGRDAGGSALDSAPAGDSATTGHDSDSGFDTGSPLDVWETEGPCGAFAGVQRVGTKWTYVPSDSYKARYDFDGSYTIAVTAIDTPDSPARTVTLFTDGHYAGDGGSFTWTRTDTWRCDADGAWWTRSEAVTDAVSGANEAHSEGWRTFDPGWLVRPAEAVVGASWTDAFVYRAEVNGSASEPVEVSCVSAVDAEGTRATEAGDLLARHVDVDCTGVTGHPFWMVEYLGMVETEDEILAGYVP